MRINHNISARMANVNLKKADARVSSSLERLTSGNKITKAADDAAGLAITNKMRAQIRALDQSSRNTEDGQSIIETAEGALNEVGNILQRIRELAVQAANDTYTLEDRKAIQDEIDQLTEEIDRISSTTEFNGTSLLDGSAARTFTSSKADVNAVSVSMDVEKGDYGLSIGALATQATTNLAVTKPSVIEINDTTIEISATDSDATVREKIIEVCDAMDIDVSGQGTALTLTTRAPGSAQKIEITIDGVEQTPVFGKDAEVELGDGFKDSASYFAEGNLIHIVDNDGFDMQIELEPTAAGDVVFSVYDAGYMTIQIGANEGQTLDMNFPAITCLSLGLKTSDGTSMINCCTQFGATNTITAMDAAIQKVANARSQFGAYENRLESTSASLDITSQNLTEAMSRISDTDMADEMTDYTQQDILSQAATSMLAQANNRPQQIMALLQG